MNVISGGLELDVAFAGWLLQVGFCKLQDSKAQAQAWCRGSRDSTKQASKRELLQTCLEKQKQEFGAVYRTSLNLQHYLQTLRRPVLDRTDSDAMLCIELAK